MAKLLEAAESAESGVAAYCADVLCLADRYRIPPVFAAMMPEVAPYSNPQKELYWEESTVTVFHAMYEARQYGRVQVFDVLSGVSGSLKMPFFGISIEAPEQDTQDSTVDSKLLSYAAGYAKAWQAAYEGLSNSDADTWLSGFWEHGGSLKKLKKPDDSFYHWDLVQVRVAWEVYIKQFEDMMNFGLLGYEHFLSVDELSVIAQCSSQFFLANTRRDSKNTFTQLKQLYDLTLIIHGAYTDDPKKYDR